jgi:two-component system, LytTR family, response regulator
MRVLIVDDEPLARSRLRRLVEARPDLALVGESPDGERAVEDIRNLRPDLVLLDIEMPERNGFEVIEEIGPENMPAVIFITAFDDYAIQAFEVHALDYLMKPFDDERFVRAVARARERLRHDRTGRIGDRLAMMLSEMGSVEMEEPPDGRKHLERVTIRSAGRVQFVRVQEIDWIEGSGVYVKLHTAAKSYLLRETLNNLEAQLDPTSFVRIHRSTIVNVERIVELRPHLHGEYYVFLQDGTELKLSRRYRSGLSQLLGRHE